MSSRILTASTLILATLFSAFFIALATTIGVMAIVSVVLFIVFCIALMVGYRAIRALRWVIWEGFMFWRHAEDFKWWQIPKYIYKNFRWEFLEASYNEQQVQGIYWHEFQILGKCGHGPPSESADSEEHY